MMKRILPLFMAAALVLGLAGCQKKPAKDAAEPTGGGAEPVSVLFVCTGNTCRSPMAEVLAAKVFADKGIEAVVASAGTAADVGAGASRNAVLAMQAKGLDLSAHVSQQVTKELVAQADVVLAMTQKNKDAVLELPGTDSEKIFLLHEYAMDGLSGVGDPYGRRQAAYEATAAEMEAALLIVADRLAGAEITPTQATAPTVPLRILFVDDTNTDTSAMAEAIAKNLFAGTDAEIASAGLAVDAAAPASDAAQQAMTAIELDLSGHQSTPLTVEMMDTYDFVIAMTAAQKEALEALPTETYPSIRLLNEIVKISSDDIADPTGQDAAAYINTVGQLTAALERLA